MQKLSSDLSLIKSDARRSRAWPAFVQAMDGRAYGQEALHAAWYWFRGGRSAREAHAAHSLPRSRMSMRRCGGCDHAHAYHRGPGTLIAEPVLPPSEYWWCAYPAHQDGSPCECTGFKAGRSSDLSLVEDPDARSHLAWPAFVQAISGHEYGWDPLNDAWCWFRMGWGDPLDPSHPLAPRPMSKQEVRDLVERARAATTPEKIQQGRATRARWAKQRGGD